MVSIVSNSRTSVSVIVKTGYETDGALHISRGQDKETSHHQKCGSWDAGGGPKPRLNQLNICTNSSHFLSLVSSYSAKLGCSQCSGLWTSVYLHPYIHTSILIHHPNTITEDSIQQNLISCKMKLKPITMHPHTPI